MTTALLLILTFGAYPIWFLYFHNIDKVSFSDLITTLLPILLITTISTLILNRKINNLQKSACLASVFLFLFFLYGHLASFAPNIYLATNLGPINKHFAIIPLWLICTIHVLKEIGRAKDLKSLNTLFIYIGSGLIITNLLFSLPKILSDNPNTNDNPNLSTQNINLPDIYHIVLDGHAREDILRDLYGFDNSAFTNELKNLGFHVVEKSRSNYSQTYLSMASTFDMNYVNDLSETLGRNSIDRTPLQKKINNGAVISNLEKIGYKIIIFESGWSGTKSLNAQIDTGPTIRLREFHMTLLGTSPIIHLSGQDFRYDLHRINVLNSLAKIPIITTNKEPTFAYIHMLTPHPPFVFDKNGQKVKQNVEFDLKDPTWKFSPGRNAQMYKSSYIDQLQFIDAKILEALRETIQNSPTKPIIILQSDHGPALTWYDSKDPDLNAVNERTANLLALYLPEQGLKDLHKLTTPVNMYRLIFNTYFSANYPLLSDNYFISPFQKPYDFKEVTDEMKKIDEATPN